MVNVPKERMTFCNHKACKKHTKHKVAQYKTAKKTGLAQGDRRYNQKQRLWWSDQADLPQEGEDDQEDRPPSRVLQVQAETLRPDQALQALRARW